MTDGGYTLEEARALQKFSEKEPLEACSLAAVYDGEGPPPCLPICKSCLDKWLKDPRP